MVISQSWNIIYYHCYFSEINTLKKFTDLMPSSSGLVSMYKWLQTNFSPWRLFSSNISPSHYHVLMFPGPIVRHSNVDPFLCYAPVCVLVLLLFVGNLASQSNQ